MRAVEIRGVRYPSLSEAARRLAVSRQVVHKAADAGLLDTVGLGRPAEGERRQARVIADQAREIEALTKTLARLEREKEKGR